MEPYTPPDRAKILDRTLVIAVAVMVLPAWFIVSLSGFACDTPGRMCTQVTADVPRLVWSAFVAVVAVTVHRCGATRQGWPLWATRGVACAAVLVAYVFLFRTWADGSA